MLYEGKSVRGTGMCWVSRVWAKAVVSGRVLPVAVARDEEGTGQG